MNDAKIIIVSAPSGCGKGTILAEVLEKTGAFLSISCTTRGPRVGEENGVNYHFITQDEFDKIIDDNAFLEYARFVGKSYGTPAKPVDDAISQGRDAILEIETKGAFQVKESRPESVSIFILPPSIKELERRLRKRATETEEKILERVAQAAGEIEKSPRYDYVIMNDALEDAIRDFELVVSSVKANDNRADKFKAENMKETIEEVLKNA